MKIRLSDHPDCIHAPECDQIAGDLYRTLATGRYDWPASILRLDDFDGYMAAHRTARKRAARAARLGYTVTPIERAHHADAIHAINTSAPERQGRPMASGYLERPDFDRLPDYPCARHWIRSHGVFTPDGALVAYLVLHVSGDLALVSQILGHADHLADDVMYLLVAGTLRDVLKRSGPATVFYNRHDSGTPGLRFFKERLGFTAERVEWAL